MTIFLAFLLASTYPACSLFSEETQEKKPASTAPSLVVKEKFFAKRANNVMSIKFSPNGKLLAECDSIGRITVCDAMDGKQTVFYKGNPQAKENLPASLVDFSPDGQYLLGCVRYLHVIFAWDIESGKQVFRVLTEREGPHGVVFHPIGKLFGMAVGGGIEFRDAKTGHLFKTLETKLSFEEIAFSTDGKQLARAIRGKTKGAKREAPITIWDIESGKELKALTGHEGGVSSICFSPCAKWIASGSHDKTVRIWDTTTGETVRTIQFPSAVRKIAWSPNGKWLVIGSSGKKVISIWDPATGTEILEVKTRIGSLYGLALNAEGTLLAAAGLNRVEVWEISEAKAAEAKNAQEKPPR